MESKNQLDTPKGKPPASEFTILHSDWSEDKAQSEEMDLIPRDRYNVTLIAMFMMGVASLLPWSFFTTAENYWMYKFRNTSEDAETAATNTTAPLNPMQQFFMAYLSMTSNIVYLFCLGVNLYVSKRVGTHARIFYPLLVTVALFGVITAMVKVNTDHVQIAFLILTLLIVALINIVVAFQMGASMGICGYLPSRFMSSNSLGQAMGGLICCATQICCQLLNLNPLDSATIYFLTAMVFLSIATYSYVLMKRSNFFQHNEMKAEKANETIADDTRIPYKDIFIEGWHYHVGSFIVYGVTLSVFPSLVVLIQSANYEKDNTLTDVLFVTLATFTTYNFADCVGRYLFNWFAFNPKRTVLFLSVSAARVMFIPLFLWCNVAPENRVHSSVLFNSDTVFILLNLLAGISNGYLITASYVHGPKTTDMIWQDISANIVTIFAALGCAVGSVISYGVVWLV